MLEVELKILEALENGCASIAELHRKTGLNYDVIRKRVSSAWLITLRERADYQKLEGVYKKGVTSAELKHLTGIPTWRIRALLKTLESELEKEQRRLADCLFYSVVSEAATEDPVFTIAYIYHRKPHVKLSFEEIYRRVKDISEGSLASECARKWGISNAGATLFARAVGLGKRNKKAFKKGKLRIEFSNQKHS